MKIPTLHTKRITLRPPRLDDFEAYASMVTSPRAQFMEEGLSRKDAWGWFCSDAAHWHFFGFGALMIEETGEETSVEQVAVIKDIDFPEEDLGWLLHETYGGHGLATEAAVARRTFAFDQVGLNTLVSYIDHMNTASIAVAERHDAVRDSHAPSPEPQALVYRHQAAEAL